jgi:methyl coenzyme M reductase subunit C
MTRTFKTIAAVAALTLGAAAPAFAQSQLIASAGLTPAEAQGLTLNQIAAAKYNRDRSHTDRQAVVVVPGSADSAQLAASVGLAPGASLNEIAAAKDNRDESPADWQVVREADVTVSTRAVGGDTGAWSQLIASAGLTPAEAEGLTLNQIAAVKYNSDGISHADRQRVRN